MELTAGHSQRQSLRLALKFSSDIRSKQSLPVLDSAFDREPQLSEARMSRTLNPVNIRHIRSLGKKALGSTRTLVDEWPKRIKLPHPQEPIIRKSHRFRTAGSGAKLFLAPRIAKGSNDSKKTFGRPEPCALADLALLAASRSSGHAKDGRERR